MGFLRLLLKPFKWLSRIFRSKKKRDAQATEEDSSPKPVRISLLGHTATGKTVFYAMLYDELRKNADLQMSATSAPTADFLHRTINMLKGLEDAEDEYGRRITRPVEPKFPAGTVDGGTLTFSVKPSGEKLIPLEMIEYAGEALGLHSIDTLSPEAREFFLESDCVFFMLDATMLEAQVELEARIESLNILLNAIAGTRDRAAIPLAFIVSKADTLPGFQHEDQVALIPPSIPVTPRTDFDRLKSSILDSEVVSREPVWQQEVDRVLTSISRLVRVVLHHADRFQIFFVSSIGKPDKSVDEFGVPRESPPSNIRSLGLVEPFAWWARTHRMRRREQSTRRFARVAGILSVVFMLFAAAWHYPFHRSRFEKVVERWDEDPCAAQLVYRNTWGNRTLHGETFTAMNFGQFEMDPRTKKWTCLEPAMSCDKYAQTNLAEFGCEPQALDSPEALGECLELVRDLEKKLKERAVSLVAGDVAGEDAAEEETSQYARCWKELRPLVRKYVRDPRSKAGDAANKGITRLVRRVLSFSSSSPAETQPILALVGEARGLVGRPAPEGEEQTSDNLIEELVGREPADFFRQLSAVLDPTGDGSVVAGCDSVAALLRAGRIRSELPAHPMLALEQFRNANLRSGLEEMARWHEERSFYCLEQVSCSNLGNAQKESVDACKAAITAYMSSGPPPGLMNRARQLDLRANNRHQTLIDEGLEAQIIAAGAAGAAGGDSAAGGGGAAGGGAGPNGGGAGGSGGAGQVSPAASNQWRGIWLLFRGFAEGEAELADHLYVVASEQAPWSEAYALWEFSQANLCLPRGESRYFSVALDANEPGAVRDTRFPRYVRWEDLERELTDAGRVEGGKAVLEETEIVFGNNAVHARFKLEATDEECP